MTKSEFKVKAKNQIDEIVEKINSLEAKKENFKDAANSNYEEKLSDLKHKRDELKVKYQNLQDAAEDKWEEAKEAFEESTNKFKAGIDRLVKAF